jgi:hypothetical protein
MGAPILLDYGHPRRFPPIPWKPLLKIAPACVVLAYTALTMLRPDTRTTVSLCTKCGIYETTTEQCLPFTSIAIHRSPSQTQTSMSLVVDKHHLQLFHRHQFVMVRISGPRHSVSGPAALLQNRVSLPFSNFIDSLATNSDPWTTEEWLDRILDPNRSFPWLTLKLSRDPPPNNLRKFCRWWEGFKAGRIRNPGFGHVIIHLEDFSQPTGKTIILPDDQDDK